MQSTSKFITSLIVTFVLWLSPAHSIPDTVALEAQKALKSLGYEPGPADGIVGEQTKRAIRAYQIANGLEPTGFLDGKTTETLLGVTETLQQDSGTAEILDNQTVDRLRVGLQSNPSLASQQCDEQYSSMFSNLNFMLNLCHPEFRTFNCCDSLALLKQQHEKITATCWANAPLQEKDLTLYIQASPATLQCGKN
jgi:hypothetical protein